MSGWPTRPDRPQHPFILSSIGPTSLAGDAMRCIAKQATASQAWPAENMALYIPVSVQEAMSISKLAIWATVAEGVEFDIGIYSYTSSGTSATRLAHSGKTTVGAGTSRMEAFEVGPVSLSPGIYFLAMVAKTTTGTFKSTKELATGVLRASGVQQQALGEPVLPETATLANPASEVVPLIVASGRTTL